MTHGSIRLRLILFAAIGVIVAIGLSGLGLATLFERHVERRLGQELDADITRLAAGLRIGADGKASLSSRPPDPRFEQVFSGLYWQINDEVAGTNLRSRSLWDVTLGIPANALPFGETRSDRIEGPERADALLHQKTIILEHLGQERRFTIAAAADRASLTELRSGFLRDLLPGLVLLGGLIIMASWLQISAGLRPLGSVRRGLIDIKAGRVKQLSAAVPDEIRPLVDEFNSLLQAQETALVRARDHAADLAHGLRTPLTALAGDVSRLRAAGQDAIADDIELLAAQMRRTVERELARARARHRSSAAPPVSVAPLVDAIMRTLSRTPQGEALAFDNEIDAGVSVLADRDDLSEILGNLLENASRHAKARVRVSASAGEGMVTILIDDDGPGSDPARMERLSARGVRQDETGGAGIGLAIVGDLLAIHDGRLAFAPSDLGGLSAQVSLRGAA